jgi:hypothetical protein
VKPATSAADVTLARTLIFDELFDLLLYRALGNIAHTAITYLIGIVAKAVFGIAV